MSVDTYASFVQMCPITIVLIQNNGKYHQEYDVYTVNTDAGSETAPAALDSEIIFPRSSGLR